MKTYYVRFGSGDPRPNFGLSPTFLIFNNNGNAVTPPAIAEVTGATGFYSFQYGTTTPIVFLLDGATTGLDASVRYVSGSIDPADRADEYGTTLVSYWTGAGSTLAALGTTNVALGTTNVALGTTNIAIGTSLTALGNTILSNTGSGVTLSGLIGTPSSAIGSTSVDPTDLFGYLKRAQEFKEGNQAFNKTSGVWSISSRGNTLLATKTLTQSSSQVAKS